MRKVTTALVLAVLAIAGALVTTGTAQAAGKVLIYKVQYNPPGADRGSNSSLNAEYVVLKNTASYTKNMTDYTLRDRQGHIYRFGTTRLSPGKVIYVRTGSGADNYQNRYQDRSWYIWNNDGDKAYLRSPSGTLLDSCEWGSSGSYKYC